MKLKSREEFKESVSLRDKGKCIICGKDYDEVHHITERKLWKDGGYYLNNGASLCNFHHRQAESNILCPQYLSYILDINLHTPGYFKESIDYNKWGEEFDMPREFDFKYPSTWYLPFSPSVALEDNRRKCESVKHLIGVPLVSSIKMDGSNSRMTNEKAAARNGHQAIHSSFDLLKNMFESRIKYLIPENLIIFGEWIYAQHSIKYEGDLSLHDYFQCFSIYDRNKNIFLDWNTTKDLCKKFNISTVPILSENKVFHSEWEIVKYLSKLGEDVVKQGHEGIVVRSAYGYHYSQHKDFVLKYVRINHVQTDKMWSHKPVIKNQLNAMN